MLFLPADHQEDSIGYNVVADLSTVVYGEIMSRKVLLWNGPDKKKVIPPGELLDLEKTELVDFRQSRKLFVYELWDTESKKSSWSTQGFFFSTSGRNGQPVPFGYVDFQDLDSLLRFELLETNANGNCRTALLDALRNHAYSFEVVQIGDRKVEDRSSAVQAHFELLGLIQKKSPWEEPDCKRIQWTVEDTILPLDESRKLSLQMLHKFSEYLEANREVFYNLGGEKILKLGSEQLPVKVTSMQVLEEWTKSKDGVATGILSVVLFINGQPMDPLEVPALEKLDFLVQNHSLVDLMNRKEFYFRILRINRERISPAESARVLEHLENGSWSRISEKSKFRN